MTIRSLFDPKKQIDRRIEKVIQYDNVDPEFLKKEIGEYIVTDSMTRSLDKLLDAIDLGMGEGSNEIGVWVSGFYGSGKSSFTKYLGFALDDSFKIDGKPFLRYLQDRVTDAPLRQRLATVASRHRPAVIMLDLASEQLAGASMAEISTVLYAKVMQWAGYSRDRKVAYLEFMLERDSKFDQFKKRIEELSGGMSWNEIRNQPLVSNQLASQLASEFYRKIYPTSKSFHDQKLDEVIKTDDQARDMIGLVRRRSGRENIVFVVDEVGQYVAARDSLILNLDGLAKNLKQIGCGKVWLMATAQQTLTEDDPRAQVNTPKLFKLKDRFPILADLEASDIREICYLRLLGKTKQAEDELEKLFEKHGPQFRFLTKLKNTRYYQRDLDKKSFIHLYPFLPQHFDLLLELLGRLAKSMGGVGLRSAIKVIQDVLISTDSGALPLADQPLGTLATTVTFYDTLRRDIQRSYRHVVEGVDKAVKNFGTDSVETHVAKTVAILQVLEDFPVSRENVAALVFPAVDAASQQESVNRAVENLMAEETVPLSEIEGNLRFMSEAVAELENERRDLLATRMDRLRIFNDVLHELFTPVPRASLNGTRTVQCGIKAQGIAAPVSIVGEKEEVQILVEFAHAAEFASLKSSRIADSTQPTEKNTIFVLGVEPDGTQQQLEEIHRCDQIYNAYRNKTVEKEVGEYLNGQQQRAKKIRGDLAADLRKCLEQGSFVFQARPKAVASRGFSLEESAKKELEEAAAVIFHKYNEAPIQAESALAERFLKTERLDRIESRNDPLGLVANDGRINSSQPALKSVTDYLNQVGREEGRNLLDKFSGAPFGWSKDTFRYLVAALLVGGEVKLRVSGEDITVRGPTANESLKSNTAFNRVGVSLRDGVIDQGSKLRAADRLVEITGEQVLPIEDEISKIVTKRFPDLQRDYAHLSSELRNLKLAGEDRANRVQDSLSEILKGDASDAAARLGSEECAPYDDLMWARQVAKALTGDLPTTARRANRALNEILKLPDIGPLADLRANTKEDLEKLREALRREDFFTHTADIQTQLSHVDIKIEQAAKLLGEEYAADLDSEKLRLEGRPEWKMIGGEEQERLATSLDELQKTFELTLDGIQDCLNARYPLQQRVVSVERNMEQLAAERERTVEEQEQESGGTKETSVYHVSDFSFPSEVDSAEQLDAIIRRLQELKAKFVTYARITFGRPNR
jgi:hypothetical protein